MIILIMNLAMMMNTTTTMVMRNLFRQHWCKSSSSVEQELHLARNVPGGQDDDDDDVEEEDGDED